MKPLLIVAAVAFASLGLQRASGPDVARWERQAQNVTIVRDDWGIAHVHGKTDADAVFGMVYAQAEEDVQRTAAAEARRAGVPAEEYLVSAAAAPELLSSLSAASDKLTADFGTWKTPWGDINRFQRISDDLVHPFTDAGPSIPVPFTTGTLGSLASFAARPYKGSKKIYGTSGNSFVAVVEFCDRVRAKAVTAGGESGHPSSPHFNDQAQRYSTGDLRDVYFYPSQLKGHIEREYRPGR